MNKNEISEILIAIHNACICLEKENTRLIEEKEYSNAGAISRNIDALKKLSKNIKNIEKAVVEEVLDYFNDELFNQGWESVKTWIDSKGRLKFLKKHDYDLSIKVLNNISEDLVKKYLEDTKMEDNLIY